MSVYVTGDLHGYIDDLYYRINNLTSGDELIIAGDVGFVYGQHFSNKLAAANAVAEDCNVKLIVLRGNHDTRYCRDIKQGRFGSWSTIKHWNRDVLVIDAYPQLIFLDDAAQTYDMYGKTLLTIPGAYSIDIAYRHAMGWPFEEEEMLSYQEIEDLLNLAEQVNPDFIISHTCPISWMPIFKDLLLDGIVSDNTMEQALEGVLYQLEKRNALPETWYFGHFHDNRTIYTTCGHMLLNEVVKII